MGNMDSPVGITQAGAHLTVVRSALGIIVQAMVVLVGVFLLVNLSLNFLGVPEGVSREFYEILLTFVFSLPLLYPITLRPLTRIAAEHAAASAEARFWAVAHAAHDGILIFDAEKKIRFANAAAERMYGYPEDSLQGKQVDLLMPTGARAGFTEAFQAFLSSQQSKIIGRGLSEQVGMRRNGEHFPVEISVSELMQDDKREFVVVMRDISARKQAEDELQERTAHLNALIANSPLAIVVVDRNGGVRMCNTAFEELFQYRSVEIAGLELDSLVAPKSLMDEASGFTMRNLGGQISHATTQRCRKDGTLVDVEVHGVPMLIEGRIEGAYGIYQDISERNKLKLYEQILPVCCVCGKIRDDQGVESGAGSWDRLDQYITRHTDARLSHTFCPPCLEEYRRREGLPSGESSAQGDR
jgi:PAS domain S-box-containing protein